MTMGKRLSASIFCALGVALMVTVGLPVLGVLLGTTTFQGPLASAVLLGLLVIGAFVGLTIEGWVEKLCAEVLGR